MNAAQWHLAVNHAPVFAVAVALGFLAVGFVRRHGGARRLGLAFLIAAALVALPAFLSGEPTEELVEHGSGISHALIHRHEEAAELAFYFLIALGLVATVLGILERRGRSLPQAVEGALILGTLFAFLLVGRAGHYGGEIRHPEIRWDAGQAVEDVGLSPKTESHESVDPD